jgi:hypothetical protein
MEAAPVHLLTPEPTADSAASDGRAYFGGMDAMTAVEAARKLPALERERFFESVYIALRDLLQRGERLEPAWEKALRAAWTALHPRQNTPSAGLGG